MQTRHEVQRLAEHGSIQPLRFAVAGSVYCRGRRSLEALDQEGTKVAKNVATQHFEQIGILTDWLQELLGGNGYSSLRLGIGKGSRICVVPERTMLRQIDELKAQTPRDEAYRKHRTSTGQ